MGTDSQVASLGTECNQNLKVCVYRLQRLLSFVGLLYSSRKVRSVCLIILQTLTLYQQFFLTDLEGHRQKTVVSE